MQTLNSELKLHNQLNNDDLLYVTEVIKDNNLSYYLLDINDFFAIKNQSEKIVAFGRMQPIGENCKELSSIRVDQDYRGQKLGIYLCNELIKQKRCSNNLYLSAKPSLGKYYGTLGFDIITENIPEKLIYTLEWAKDNGLEFIVMKYKD